MAEQINRETRLLVAQQAEFHCEYCRCPEAYGPDSFSVEHIQPRSRSGSDEPANLAYACQGCNSRKFVAMEAIDPVTGDTVSLFHPRQHSWRDHFAWEYDFTVLIGVSPIGRATIERLQLNRINVVNLRRVLRQTGIYPRESPRQK